MFVETMLIFRLFHGKHVVYTVDSMFILQKFIGNVGENYAENYLKTCGYTIIARQHKVKFAEIDIIAAKDSVLYIFEVKSVSRETSRPENDADDDGKDNTINFDFCLHSRVDGKKVMRMRQFAQYYFNNHPEYSSVALGVIGVILPLDSDRPLIEIFWV